MNRQAAPAGFTQGSIAQVIKMHKLRWFMSLATLALAACGSSSNCDTSFANSCGTTTAASTVTSVLLVSDVATIPSDDSLPAKLTAYVRDANNNFVTGAPVVFTVDTGGVSVTQGTTDANGVALASLNTLGDKTNRTITITAATNKVVASATVDVVGTALKIQGPKALTSGQQSPYTVSLVDSAGHGISGKVITVTAPSNLTVDSTSVTTDGQGNASFMATGGSGGSGSLSVAGLGLSNSITVAVNADSLSFTAPAVGAHIALNTLKTFTVHWATNGTPVTGQPINFATTRGCINPAGATCVGQLSTAQVNTNGSGDASVALLSDNAGGATVTATTATATAASISVQFIATNAASIDVQPDLFTLGPNDNDTISAIVRDANNNLVTGSVVVFSLNDVTGGTLSLASATTDLQGRAQTVYTAGSVASAANGVKVTATVQSAPAVKKTVSLTVAKRQVFISIGTGNAIVADALKTQYEKDYVVQVTDSNGAGVSGVPLSMSVLSNIYFKGYRFISGTAWYNCFTFPVNTCTDTVPPASAPLGAILIPDDAMGCTDEDTNRNGILDPGENKNGINPATGTATLEAGNIALVSPSSLTTDANGFAFVKVFYPEEYAYYLKVTLQAQASVQGTAFSAQSVFVLPGLADDFNDIKKAPPGLISPFGQSNSCTDMK